MKINRKPQLTLESAQQTVTTIFNHKLHKFRSFPTLFHNLNRAKRWAQRAVKGWSTMKMEKDAPQVINSTIKY